MHQIHNFMNIEQALAIENRRTDPKELGIVHIFKETRYDNREKTEKSFYRVYEWSCYLVINFLINKDEFKHPVNPFRTNDDIHQGFCAWGVPKDSLKKIFSEEFSAARTEEEHLTFVIPEELLSKIPGDTAENKIKAFDEWKKTLKVSKGYTPNKEDKNNQRNIRTQKNSHNAILQQFLALDPMVMSGREILSELMRIREEYFQYNVYGTTVNQ